MKRQLFLVLALPDGTAEGLVFGREVNIAEVAQSVPPQRSEERGEGWGGGSWREADREV